VDSNSKEIAKLKKRSRKWSSDVGFAGVKTWFLTVLPYQMTVFIIKKFLIQSEYRLKRESIKFFQLSNRAYGAKKSRKSVRLLRVAIELLGPNLSISYQTLLRDAISETLKNSKNRGHISDLILLGTKQLEQEIFDATGWYQLSRGLFSLGYFRAAWAARENSLDLSILEGKNVFASGNELYRALQANLERRNVIDAQGILQKIEETLAKEQIGEVNDYLKLIQGLYNNQWDENSCPNESNRAVLRGIIFGKSVGLVGPGTPHGDYGKAIDSLETVVRIKFTDEKMLDGRCFHGSRTEVTFIGALSSFAGQYHLGLPTYNGLKLILSDQTSHQFVGDTPVCVIEGKGELYRSPSTSGIRTLLEVVKNSPSKLIIYGFDFYSTLTPYSKEMTEFYETSSWRFGHPNDFVNNGVYFKFARARDFSVHDPVSNFCFAQNLYKAGLFDIEPFGKSILELTPFQYVERLEEMLGDW